MSDVTDQYLLSNPEGPTKRREPIRIPPKNPHQYDTTPRMDGSSGQLYNGVTLPKRTGPTEEPEVLPCITG